MNSVVVRTLFSLFIPGGLVVFTTAILLYMGTLDKSLSALVHVYPYGHLLHCPKKRRSVDSQRRKIDFDHIQVVGM